MIPPLAPPNSDNDRARLPDLVTHAHRQFAAPPVPVPGIEHADMVLTGRNTWVQPAPEQPRTEGFAATKDEGLRRIAQEASATPNPLRGLITELTRFADQLDAQGVVPLGIHTCTAYKQTLSQYRVYGGQQVAAEVVTTVRGVRREWIDQHRTPDEPGSPEQVAPADCACRNWATDMRLGTWGVEHHPKCDGTGQHIEPPLPSGTAVETR